VRYTKVVSTHDGGSRFEDVDVEMKTALAAKGVPSAAIQTSDGARREFGPGDVVLVEDTTGVGHVSTPMTCDFRIAVVPLS
jgi:uncharacterized protein YjlB